MKPTEIKEIAGSKIVEIMNYTQPPDGRRRLEAREREGGGNCDREM